MITPVHFSYLTPSIKRSVFCLLYAVCACVFIAPAQSYFEQLEDEAGYMCFGFGVQTNALKNGYTISGNQVNDRANGTSAKFAYVEYGENGWYKLDGSLLFQAVVSAFSKHQGMPLRTYNADKNDTEYKYYFLNDKFMHASCGWGIGGSGIGPLLSFGWEGVGLIRANNKKGGAVGDAIGEENLGLISMGTGISVLHPFGNSIPHSRLTFSYDWFLNRKNADKFWFGGAGRGRFEIAYSLVVARRLTLMASYSHFNFKNAYQVQDNNSFENYSINAKITTFELGFGYNIIAR